MNFDIYFAHVVLASSVSIRPLGTTLESILALCVASVAFSQDGGDQGEARSLMGALAVSRAARMKGMICTVSWVTWVSKYWRS